MTDTGYETACTCTYLAHLLIRVDRYEYGPLPIGARRNVCAACASMQAYELLTDYLRYEPAKEKWFKSNHLYMI